MAKPRRETHRNKKTATIRGRRQSLKGIARLHGFSYLADRRRQAIRGRGTAWELFGTTGRRRIMTGLL
jgi:hypothetical protein